MIIYLSDTVGYQVISSSHKVRQEKNHKNASGIEEKFKITYLKDKFYGIVIEEDM